MRALTSLGKASKQSVANPTKAQDKTGYSCNAHVNATIECPQVACWKWLLHDHGHRHGSDQAGSRTYDVLFSHPMLVGAVGPFSRQHLFLRVTQVKSEPEYGQWFAGRCTSLAWQFRRSRKCVHCCQDLVRVMSPSTRQALSPKLQFERTAVQAPSLVWSR